MNVAPPAGVLCSQCAHESALTLKGPIISPKNPKGLLIFFHGYGGSGECFFHSAWLETCLTRQWAVWAPHGPYPWEGGSGMGYQWFSLASVTWNPTDYAYYSPKNISQVQGLLAPPGALIGRAVAALRVQAWKILAQVSSGGEHNLRQNLEGHPLLSFRALCPVCAAGDGRYEKGFFVEKSRRASIVEPVSVSRATPEPFPIVLGGFSQGGTMALYSALFTASSLEAVLGFSTFYPPLGPVKFHPKVFWAHGDQDNVVPYVAMEQGATFLKGQGLKVTTRDIPGAGHVFDVGALRGALAFLEE